MSTKQLNLRLEEEIVQRLEAVAANSNYKSGSQAAIDFITGCVEWSERLNAKVAKLAKQYDVPPSDVSVFELIQNYEELYLQAIESEMMTRQQQREFLGKARASASSLMNAPPRRKAG